MGARVAHHVTLPASEEDLLREWDPWITHQSHVLHGRYRSLIDMDDLAQEARIGFLQAARSWDPTKGCPFKTWAMQRIRGQVMDELRRRDPVSRHDRANIERLLADDTEGMPHWQIERARTANLATKPLMSLDGDQTFEESLIDTTPSVLDDLVDADTHAEVADVMAAILRPKEQDVLRMHFLEGRTLADIGAEFGFTESRACQVKNRALAKLRRAYTASVSLLLQHLIAPAA